MLTSSVYAYGPGIVEFLYDIGMGYYEKGEYGEALHEFNKALLLDPDNEKALAMIKKIKDIKQKKLMKRKSAITQQLLKQEAKLKEIKKPKKDLLRDKAVTLALDKIEKTFATQQKPLTYKVAQAVKMKIQKEAKIPKIEKPSVVKEKKPINKVRAPIMPKEEEILPEPEEKKLAMAQRPREGGKKERWLKVKKEEIITSKELEDYSLFGSQQISINGKTFKIGPIISKEDDVWLPIEEIAKILNMTMFELDKDSYMLTRADGNALELNIGAKEVLVSKRKFLELSRPILKYKGNAMVNLEDLGKLLAMDVNCDLEKKFIAIESQPGIGKFVTYAQAKPKEEKEKEPEEEEEVTYPAQEPKRLGRRISMPAEFQPDIRLRFNTYTSYLYNNLNTDLNRKTFSLTSRGDIYDYYFISDFDWEENTATGSLEETGKFVGLFGEDKHFRFLDLSTIIPHLRSQNEGYEGFEFTKFYNPFTTGFFIGNRRAIDVPGTGGVSSVRYKGHILGFNQSYSSDKLYSTLRVLGLDADADTQAHSGLTSFPRRNIVWVQDSTLHLTDYLDISGQYAMSNYYPDNNKDELFQDHNWRLETRLDSQRLFLRYAYEFVGTDYASLGNPANYQDYKGWSLVSSYRLTSDISFHGSLRKSQDNVDEQINQITNENKAWGLGTSIRLPEDIYTSFDYNDTISEDTLGAGSKSKFYRFSLFKNWRDFSLQFSYDRNTLEILENRTGSHSDTYSIFLYKFLPALRGSYLSLRQSLIDEKSKTPGTVSLERYNTNFNFRYYFTRKFSMFGSWRINTTIRPDKEDDFPMSYRLSAQWDITKDTNFGVDYSFGPYDLKDKDRQNSDAWSLFFRLSHSFGINSPAKWGRIEGRVFLDANVNGVYDEGDIGLRDILVEVLKENAVKTDRDGRFVIKEVIPGEKTLKVNTLDLPIELTAKDKFVRTVKLAERQTKEVNFLLVENGNIKGRVFVDANNNGVFDEGEEGIDEVDIFLLPNRKVDFTDEMGRFFFEYLYPQEYTLQIDEEDMPIDVKLVSPSKQKVQLQPGQQLEVNFAVVAKPIATQEF